MTVHVHPHISVHPHVTPHVHITPHSVPHSVPHATPHVTPRTAPRVAPTPHTAPHVETTPHHSSGMGIAHPLHPLNPFPWSVWRRGQQQPAAETQAHTTVAVQPQPEQPADYFGVKIIAGIALATALVLLALWGLKHAGK